MDYDQKMRCGDEAAEHFVRALFAYCDGSAPMLFGKLAQGLGLNQDRARLYAASKTKTDAQEAYPDLEATLRSIANVVASRTTSKKRNT